MEALVSQVRAVLSTTPLHWLSLTTSLSPAQLAQAPAPHEWSAADCLQHLLDTERWVFPVRVQAFLEGKGTLAAFDPDSEGSSAADHSTAQLAAEFAERRRENLALLERVTPADLARTAHHSELGDVTLEQLLNEWAAHDLNHTVQAERSLMQPFIEACGAWRSYFADHDAARS